MVPGGIYRKQLRSDFLKLRCARGVHFLLRLFFLVFCERLKRAVGRQALYWSLNVSRFTFFSSTLNVGTLSQTGPRVPRPTTYFASMTQGTRYPAKLTETRVSRLASL